MSLIVKSLVHSKTDLYLDGLTYNIYKNFLWFVEQVLEIQVWEKYIIILSSIQHVIYLQIVASKNHKLIFLSQLYSR